MKNQTTIYQLYLAYFTPEGTVAAAEKLLPHIADSGFDIVYLSPFVKSGKNAQGKPGGEYCQKDFFTPDPKRGSNKDIISFVKRAHSLGLKVLFDIVYYHCAFDADFLKEHPDFIKRNEDQSPFIGIWTLPELNFENRELCRYLISNMEYFVKTFDIDGFRCDVGARVPVTFWREAIAAVRKIKPNLIMLNEGEWDKKEYFTDAFDVCYNFEWSYKIRDIFEGLLPANDLVKFHKESNKGLPDGKYFLRLTDTHDTSGMYQRGSYERNAGFDAVCAANVLCYCVDGVPFMLCGNEIANDCAIGYKTYKGAWGGVINWSCGFSENGQKRLALVKKLNHIRKTQKALWSDTTDWIKNDSEESVFSFTREKDGDKILAVVSSSKKSVSVTVNADIPLDLIKDPILSNIKSVRKTPGGLKFTLPPFGYFVSRF